MPDKQSLISDELHKDNILAGKANLNSPLNSLEASILDLIQTGFPIESRPYASIGKHFNISEDLAFKTVVSLKERGFIRRIGASFSSNKLGFKSTLCAVGVPENKIHEFAEFVNSFPNVTHNYLRAHDFNIWFTIIAASEEEVARIIKAIEDRSGLTVLNLPALKTYKIKVDFRL